MPLALFIIVGLGALAITISRMGSSQFSAAVQESLSAQAFYAAESGAQYGMHQLLFNAANKTAADARCAALSGDSLIFSPPGLTGCTVDLTCALINNTGDTAHIYEIQSEGSCGSSDLLAQRTLIVGARYE